MIVSRRRWLGLASVVFGVTAGASPAWADTGRVEILDFGYTPSEIVVALGDQVVWSNKGAVVHSVSPDDASAGFGTKLTPGASFVFTFQRLGTYPYHCDIYSSMRGVVRVVERSSKPGSTSTTRRASSAFLGVPETVSSSPRQPSTPAPRSTAPAGTVGPPPAQSPTTTAPGVPPARGAGAASPVPPPPSTLPLSEGRQPGNPSPQPDRPANAVESGSEQAAAPSGSPHEPGSDTALVILGAVLFGSGALVLLSGLRPGHLTPVPLSDITVQAPEEPERGSRGHA